MDSKTISNFESVIRIMYSAIYIVCVTIIDEIKSQIKIQQCSLPQYSYTYGWLQFCWFYIGQKAIIFKLAYQLLDNPQETPLTNNNIKA
jgi:hypothetical protein